jgi:3-deoxy-D-manno-octulosonate 8-phosphate phosphatase (KDO 8-P phosphatase)
MPAISAPDVRARLAQVKLLALDVDGVLTDGGLYYSDSGEEMKRFHVKDGQGLKSLRGIGIEVAIISGSSSRSTLQRAKTLGIMHTFVGTEDKLSTLKILCKKLGLSLAQVAYVGDDVNDLPVMRAVGCPLTVADAMPENRACALYVTTLGGGQGAVREICDYLLKVHTDGV